MFEDTLKDLRLENKLSQKDLAEKIGLSKNIICEYEKGRSQPSIETLNKFADIFNCSIDYLCGRADFEDIQPKQREKNPEENADEEYILKTFRSLSGRDRELFLGFVSNFDRPVSEIKKARKNRA